MLSRSLRKGSSTLARRVRAKQSKSLELASSLSSLDTNTCTSGRSKGNETRAKLNANVSSLPTRTTQLQLSDVRMKHYHLDDMLLQSQQSTSTTVGLLLSNQRSNIAREESGTVFATKSKMDLDKELLDEMSYAFYTTMHNVLRRTNTKLMTTDAFQYHQSNRHHRGSGNAMIQMRQFSSSVAPTPEKKDKAEAKVVDPGEVEASKSSSTSISSSESSSSSSASNATKTLTTKESMPDKAQAMIKSAVTTILSFLLKIPGVLWFYLTHPKEFKDKMSELKEAAKKEAHHYYMGTKLLIADLRTAKKMLYRSLQGTPLTRRERKQLIRTVTDVFRLVPMSIFVLIPFMEFALPFALKLFPNMLPSTFQDSLKAEETMKRELKSRLAMAEFFQETLQDLAKEQKKREKLKKEKIEDNDGPSSDLESTENRVETAASFLEFIEKARNGEFLPPEVVVRYAKYFEDELTLDNMHRMQLINMCKYMSVPPYGNDNLLRFQLRHKIRILLEDDQKILWEGIDSLTKMELREACQERGMRSTGLSKEAYKRALQQWIDLSVNRNVPISLLIMSRTFFLQEEMTRKESSRMVDDDDASKSVTGLADAISGLDKEVVNEVILESVTKNQNDPELTKLKLEVLEQQNELIEEENQQREAEAAKIEAMKAEKERAEQEKIEEGKVDEKVETVDEVSKEVATPLESTNDETIVPKDVFVSSEAAIEESVETRQQSSKEIEESKVSTAGAETTVEAEAEGEEEASLSSQEIDAISQLVSPDPVSAEREKLESIKAALQEDTEEEEKESVETEESDIEIYPEVKEGITEPTDVSPEPMTNETADEMAKQQITKMDDEAKAVSDASTQIAMDGEIEKSDEGEKVIAEDEEPVSEDYSDAKLDKAITRLKSKVESMVGKIEIKMSDIEAKIGDKMHILDKDMDGILSQEEMALTLQSVLKRPLTLDEAMAIAADMDENEDGYFTLEELSKWLETNKLVKLVEEGRDAEVDKIVASQAAKMKERNEEKKDAGEK